MFYIAKRYFKGHSVCKVHVSTIENKLKAMTEDDRPKLLAGDEAFDLWRKGPGAWNIWIEANPGTDISFAGFVFSIKRVSKRELSFAGYHFGNRNIDFSNAIFRTGDVVFSNAVFEGNVEFAGADFGNGSIKFCDVEFQGEVNFLETKFGDSNVDFGGCRFRQGADFTEAIFGKGRVVFSRTSFFGPADFYLTQFGEGYLEFFDAHFKDPVCFRRSSLGLGELCFRETQFNTDIVDFSEAMFGNVRIDFTDATFENCDLTFNRAKIGELIFKPHLFASERLAAQSLSIEDLAIVVFPKGSASLKFCDFQGASFRGSLFIKGNLSIVPDFRRTRASHQIELSDLEVKLLRSPKSPNWFKRFYAVAADSQDAARLRRLKEIAETNKDHQAALRFSADENRARRWIETSWLGSLLDIAFSGFSNYGQSILRPYLWLFSFFAGFIGIYKTLATACHAGWLTSLGQATLLSISNSLAFLPQSRSLRTDALKALYPGDPGFWVDALMITQGVLSFVFLFLIGLGLRNRFRL